PVDEGRSDPPAKRMSPLQRTPPVIARRVVVLPAPFAPSNETTPPSGTESDTPWRTEVGPYPAWTFSSSRIALIRLRPDRLRSRRDCAAPQRGCPRRSSSRSPAPRLGRRCPSRTPCDAPPGASSHRGRYGPGEEDGPSRRPPHG